MARLRPGDGRGRAWSARWPTGSPSPRCSGGRSGLPIPHTAIIPNRKDAIGSSLSEFVATNFLSEAVVREKLAGFSVAKRIGEFLVQAGIGASGSPPSWPPRCAGSATCSATIRSPTCSNRWPAARSPRPRSGRRSAGSPPRCSNAATTTRSSTSSSTAATSGSGTTTPRSPGWCRSVRRPGRRDSWTASSPTGSTTRCWPSPRRSRRSAASAAQCPGPVPGRVRPGPADRPGDHRTGGVDQGPDRRQRRGALAGRQRLDVDQGLAAAGGRGPEFAAAAVGHERSGVASASS